MLHTWAYSTQLERHHTESKGHTWTADPMQRMAGRPKIRASSMAEYALRRHQMHMYEHKTSGKMRTIHCSLESSGHVRLATFLGSDFAFRSEIDPETTEKTSGESSDAWDLASGRAVWSKRFAAEHSLSCESRSAVHDTERVNYSVIATGSKQILHLEPTIGK